MQVIRVSERKAPIEMVRWDGSALAAQWVAQRFPATATFSGNGDRQVLTMYGSWEIPLGDFVFERWGAFNYVPAAQINDLYQPAAPDIVVEPLPGGGPDDPPADDPPADDPPADDPPADDPPADDPPADDPPADDPPLEQPPANEPPAEDRT